MENLMNEENEWDRSLSFGVKEGPADCITIPYRLLLHCKDEKHLVSDSSGLVPQMIQVTGYIRIHWLTDLCSGIVKNGCIPEDWKSSVILLVYKGLLHGVRFIQRDEVAEACHESG